MRRLDLGAPPHVVREIAGHSDTEVTMTIYAYVSLDEKCTALGKLGEVRPADAVAVKRRANQAFALVKTGGQG
jgi:hypothetical protein